MCPSVCLGHDQEDILVIRVTFQTFIIYITRACNSCVAWNTETHQSSNYRNPNPKLSILLLCFDCRNLGGTTCLHSWHSRQSCSCVSCPSSLRALATCWWSGEMRKEPEEVRHICETALYLHSFLIMHASNVYASITITLGQERSCITAQTMKSLARSNAAHGIKYVIISHTLRIPLRKFLCNEIGGSPL